MKKYGYWNWTNKDLAREEYIISFEALHSYLHKPLPKRRLINKLKILMVCPVGFDDMGLGRRSSEHHFIIYDYNIAKEGVRNE